MAQGGNSSLHDRRDQKAAGKIDEQSTVGERGAETLCGPERHEVSCAGTGRSRQADPEEPFHVRVTFPGEGAAAAEQQTPPPAISQFLRPDN